MKIGGLQKLTLLDFPEKVACTVFLQGCNFRCPFCHNSSLLRGIDAFSEEGLFAFLKKRQGLLDGVAITGGEPLLSEGITEFIQKIKALGYAVKLDTNGSFPTRLSALMQAGLLDYVAMDIKNAPEKYDATASCTGALAPVKESLALLRSGNVPYELRTTVVDELHEEADFLEIGRWLAGEERYFLQEFKDSGDILQAGLHAASEEKMLRCLELVKTYIPNAQLRGHS